GVHLSQAFVALDGLSLASLIEEPLHGFLEGADVLAVVTAADEGAFADEARESAGKVRDPLVLGGIEELARQVLVAGGAVLCLVDHDARGMLARRAVKLHTVCARRVIERIEPLIELLDPASQPVEPIEVRRL